MSIKHFLNSHKKNLGPMVGLLFGLSFFLFVLCLIFFGSAYDNQSRYHALNLYCVDLDGFAVGAALLNACRHAIAIQTANQPTFEIQNFSNFQELYSSVRDGNAWGAVVANANATFNLNNALSSELDGTNTSYYNTSAITILFDEGRNSNTQNGVTLPFLVAFVTKFQIQFGNAFLQQLFATTFATSTGSQLTNVTHIFTQPLTYSINNIGPTNPVGVLAQTIGLILLVVFSFVFLMASHPFNHPILWSLKVWYKKWVWVMTVIFVATFFLSLSFSGTVAVYGGVQPGAFMQYWMLNWLQQLVYMSALAVPFPLLRERLGLFFVMFLVLNITSAFQNLTIEQRFYYWGYATPFTHAISATRNILFGSFRQLYIDIPVLVGMWMFSWLVLPFIIIFNMKFLVPRGLGFGDPNPKEKTAEMKAGQQTAVA